MLRINSTVLQEMLAGMTATASKEPQNTCTSHTHNTHHFMIRKGLQCLLPGNVYRWPWIERQKPRCGRWLSGQTEADVQNVPHSAQLLSSALRHSSVATLGANPLKEKRDKVTANAWKEYRLRVQIILSFTLDCRWFYHRCCIALTLRETM